MAEMILEEKRGIQIKRSAYLKPFGSTCKKEKERCIVKLRLALCDQLFGSVDSRTDAPVMEGTERSNNRMITQK